MVLSLGARKKRSGLQNRNQDKKEGEKYAFTRDERDQMDTGHINALGVDLLVGLRVRCEGSQRPVG
ncbi:hypothetical protein KKB40_06540 [Patescibacteria group bacterium]|nr:hypothetical protein [Patescibacteria group bacterium]